MKKIIIAGASSSSGKTTVTCGLLTALRKRNLSLCAYKTGPDYIDTEYLRRAGKCEAYNLDTWLLNEDLTRELFLETSKDKDIAVIEGVMGLYDGGANSTAKIAKMLNAPVILVINAKSLGESAAAIALGFKNFDNEINFAGVILNCTGSDYHEKIIADALKNSGIKFFGAIKKNKNLAIPERHLGLLNAFENDFDFEFLGNEIEKCIDINEILKISSSNSNSDFNFKIQKKIFIKNFSSEKIRTAVARDEAFSFYYPESLMALKNLGSELIFFSPLRDRKLPEAECYIFGGGFPEIFARELSENISMLESVKKCSKKILAECGGMMYLCRSIENLNGEKFKMSGLIPFDSFMTEKPVIGYMKAKALRENILCEKNNIIRGHEFHYSEIKPDFDFYNETCAFELTRKNTQNSHFGGYAYKNILASYLHVNFFGNINMAEKFLYSSLL